MSRTITNNIYASIGTDLVFDVCKPVAKYTRVRLLKQAGESALATTIDPEAALYIWIYDLLAVLPFSDKEMVWSILDAVKSRLTSFCEALFDYICEQEKNVKPTCTCPVVYLGFGDRKYVAITGSTKIYNISECEWIDGNKVQFLETIQYNLTTLFMTRYLAVQAKAAYKEFNDAHAKSEGNLDA